MKYPGKKRFSFLVLLFPVLFITGISAADFDWFKEFNIRAHADSDGFRAKIRARFEIGDAQIDVALSNFEDPADVYMVYRLSEISRKPVSFVIEKYKSGKGQGWGALAKSLGIKPGSREFHALKKGDDLYKVKGGGNNGHKKSKRKSEKKHKK